MHEHYLEALHKDADSILALFWGTYVCVSMYRILLELVWLTLLEKQRVEKNH